MSEITISALVGAPPAVNKPVDVLKIRYLLQAVRPPLANTVQDEGPVDAPTLAAIREFQKRFMASAEGRVEPGGPTFKRLQAQVHGSAAQRSAVSADIRHAKAWLGIVNRRLGQPRDEDMRRKVKNIFHIDVRAQSDAARYTTLRDRFSTLPKRFDGSFPLAFLPGAGAFAAFVISGDSEGTMFVCSNYSRKSAEERITTVIHERAHTVFAIGHAGMAEAAGTLDFGSNPDDDNGYTTEESFGNAYCYGYLAQSLQPSYRRQKEEELLVR